MSNLHRIQWIDAQIRAKRFPNTRIIAEHFEISLRQAGRDIEYLRYSLGAPLEYSAAKNGYYYSSEAFTLPQVFISEDDKRTLVYLAERYRATEGTHAGRLAELFSRLADSELRDDRVSAQLPVYDINPDVIRTHGFLREAVEKHIAVEIQYISPEENETTRIISPYKLFSRNGKAYVVGFCELREAIRVFRLDRIFRVAYTQKPYILSAEYNENNYGEENKIDYRKPYTCRIQSDARIHPGNFKFSVEHGDKYLYTIEFFDSEEMIRFLLAQPHPFSILFPGWLREKLKNRLSRIMDLNQ